MAGSRRFLLPAALAAWLTACGGDGGAATTTTTAEPGSTSTLAATVTTAPAGTTTTTATTTTFSEEVHPSWPVSWAALWPEDGSTATVRAAADEGTIDAAGGMDYGVGWDGGTWDQIWLGAPETGRLGVSFYLQRPEPWVVVLWGAETHSSNGLSMTEGFDPPLTFDLKLLPGEELSEETTVIIADGAAVIDEGPYTLTVSFVGFEAVEVAAGQFTDTAHLHPVAEEPGGFVAETDLWATGSKHWCALPRRTSGDPWSWRRRGAASRSMSSGPAARLLLGCQAPSGR